MRDKYRIKWAVVTMNGLPVRACIAERQVRLLWGAIRFWLPLSFAKWTEHPNLAENDIRYDRGIRQPLPNTKVYD